MAKKDKMIDARYIGTKDVFMPRLGRVVKPGDVISMRESNAEAQRDFEPVKPAPKKETKGKEDSK